jgi:hypothetical protein
MIARIRNISSWALLSAMVLAVLALTGSPAPAKILYPNDTDVTPGTLTASWSAGLTLVATDTVGYEGDDLVTGNPHYKGNLITSVYSDPATRGLDFTYQIVADPGYPDTLQTLSVSNYSEVWDGGVEYSTDVYYVTGSGAAETYPTTVNLSSWGPGDTITLNYVASDGEGIGPGQTSDIVVVKTNATQFDENGNMAFSDGASDNEICYEPAGPLVVVPEPMSLGLLLVGGVICAARRSRR